MNVDIALSKPPTEALMSALDHQFGAANHVLGTRVVTLSEHVAVASEQDAVQFVRALVLEAIPPGAKITQITSAPG